MTVSSAYIFGKQIKAGTPPATMFENGNFSTDFVSPYYQAGSAYAPEAPGVFGILRPQVMAQYGKEGYDGAKNLYVLGSQFDGLYSITGGNIVRSCGTGDSTDKSGCSMFIPLNNLVTPYSTISVEFKLENPKAFSYIAIGACKLTGTAYQTVIQQGSSVSGAWTTLNVQLTEPAVLDALEIQTTYGNYQIRKIVFA